MTKDVEHIRFLAEFEVAEFLKENNYITESLYESTMVDRKHSALFESRGDPYFYESVPFEHFKSVWNDFDRFHTIEQVHDALRPDNKNVLLPSKKQTIRRMLAKFIVGVSGPSDKDSKEKGIPEGRTLKAKSIEERNNEVSDYLSKKARGEAVDVDPEASIDPGQRGKKSKTGNVEKASDLIPGQLYADMTRIPQRQWGSWWRRLVQHKTSVEPPKQAITSLRKWTRHFILGYQLEDNLSYEIWYNSQDSTFSVHDRWGNPVRGGSKIPVMKDALNLLFQNVAQAAPSDIDFFKQPSNELRRVNIGLDKEGQASQQAAEQQAEQMRKRKQRLDVFSDDEEQADKQAKQSHRRRKPEQKQRRSSKEDEETYNEFGSREREEEEVDMGQKKDFSDIEKKLSSAEKKRKKAMAELRKRADASERRKREDVGDDPADSQGANSGASEEPQADSDEARQGELIPADDSSKGERQKFKERPYIVIDGAVIDNPMEIGQQMKQAAKNPNFEFGDIAFNNMPKTLINDLKAAYDKYAEVEDAVEDEPKGHPTPDEEEEPEDVSGQSEVERKRKERNKKRAEMIRKREEEKKEEARNKSERDNRDKSYSKNRSKAAGINDPEEQPRDDNVEDNVNLDQEFGRGRESDPVADPENDVPLGEYDPPAEPDLDDYGFPDADLDGESDGDIIANYNEESFFESKIMENLGSDVQQTGADEGVDLGEADQNPLYNQESNQRVLQARQHAERSQYTRQMVNNMFFEGLVKEYHQTRSRQYKGVLDQVADWFKLFRGRAEKIHVPTNIVSRSQRIKGFFSGAQARSDFIIGVSIKDKANFEIWYVQEVTSDGKEQLASFYVYDVTAEKIVKSNIPYYRNAISVIQNKIGN